MLSATEEILESVPSSIDADKITKRAKEENINADVFGPLAFDNSVSKNLLLLKKLKMMFREIRIFFSFLMLRQETLWLK